MLRRFADAALAAVLLIGAGPALADMAHHNKVIALAAGADAPSLDVDIAKDAVAGWNVHIRVASFRFAPEHASDAHRPGEGRAHIHVNGKKIARVDGPWFHIAALPSGTNEIQVALNATDHRSLAVGGEPVAKTVKDRVP